MKAITAPPEKAPYLNHVILDQQCKAENMERQQHGVHQHHHTYDQYRAADIARGVDCNNKGDFSDEQPHTEPDNQRDGGPG